MSSQLPPGGELGEVVGGADDGQQVVFIDSRNVALSLVIGMDGSVAMRGTMPHAEIITALRGIANSLARADQ